MVTPRCFVLNFMGTRAPRVELQRESALRLGRPVVYLTASREGPIPGRPGLQRVDVDTPWAERLERRIGKAGVALRYVEYLARLWRLLRREVHRGDIVLLHHSLSLGLVPLLRRRGARTVYDVIEIPAVVYRERGLTGRLFAWISDTLENRYVPQLSAVTSVPSREGWLAERLRALNPDVTEFWNLPSRAMAVDEALAARIRERFAGKELVIYAGRIHSGKGEEIFPALVRQVTAAHPSAHFLLIGIAQVPGGGEAWLEREGIAGQCTLIPWIELDALHTYLSCGHVGLFLSIAKGSMAHFGLGGERKPFTYMAAGLPFISPDYLDEFSFFSDNGVALLADTTDAGAVAEAVLKLLGDPLLRKRMAGEAQRLFQEQWCWEEHEPAFLRVLTGPEGSPQ